jgi:NADH dehydrogenase
MLPGVAPVAIAQGHHVAAGIVRGDTGGNGLAFWFRDVGQMATIGRSQAVWKTPGGLPNLGGLLAWLAWVFVHLMVLVTHRSRVLVFIKWSWAYLSFDRASRLMWDRLR